MSNYELLSNRKERIDHLQARYDCLTFGQEYHSWAKKISHDPNIEDLHQAVAEKVSETMEHLGLLIEALKQSEHPKSQKPIL